MKRNGAFFRYESEDVPKQDFLATKAFDKSKNIYVNRYKDTSKPFRGVFYLMKKWKGSVLKLLWHDIMAFLVVYFLLSVLYRTVFFHDEYQREMFELVCIYASRFRSLIPVTFLTGFYVSQVVSRYWDQFMALPFPDRVALKLVSFIPGRDHFRKNLRRTVMRYINLSFILVFRLVSQKVNNRFPTLQSLIDAKLLLQHEAERLQEIDEKSPHEATWTPVLWALKLIQKARSDKKIEIEAPVYASLVGSFDYIDTCNRKILNYGWVNFPLAYTQVATLSVFMYVVSSLFSAQYLIPQESAEDHTIFPNLNISFATSLPYSLHTPDLYFPFFTVLELLGYLGWIKVAEDLLNPFGDDDEDFQINYLIDRNLQVSYLIVDEAERQVEMADDPFLEAGIQVPSELPYNDQAHRDEASKAIAAANDDGDAPSHSRMNSVQRKISRINPFTSNKMSNSSTPTPQVRRKGSTASQIRTLSSSPSIIENGPDEDGKTDGYGTLTSRTLASVREEIESFQNLGYINEHEQEQEQDKDDASTRM